MTASLRELLTAATPAPWEFEAKANTYIQAVDPPVDIAVVVTSARDAALVVSLRNQAEALADLIDAAEHFVQPFLAMPNGLEQYPRLATLAAALSRLAATEPQAEQGGNRVA